MEFITIFTIISLSTVFCLVLKNRRLIEFVSVTAFLAVFVLAVSVAVRVSVAGVYTPNKYFSLDSLGSIVMLLISLVGLMAVIYSVKYLRAETAKQIIGFTRVKQYFIFLNLFSLAMFFAITSSSPIFAWISVEATTLSTAFLISFYNKPSSMEAAWKYLIINSVGLLLAFFGTLLYFTSLKMSGGFGFVTWNNLLSNIQSLDPAIAKIAFVFILIGYGTKVGLAPMHTWLPDAHSKAPVPISALLSGVLLNVAFVMILKFKVFTDLVVGPAFAQKLLIAFGLFSIFVAVFIIIGQKNYKRLLAYSSIENMGILALGFGFGGLAIFAAILHMIYHSLIKSALFLSAGNIFLKYSSTKIHNIKGAFTALPLTSVIFMAGFLAITGAPPFGILFTKIIILSAGLKNFSFVSIMALFLTAVLFIGFFKQVTNMMFGQKPTEIPMEKEKFWLIAPPLVLIFIALILSFYIPPFIYNLIASAAANY